MNNVVFSITTNQVVAVNRLPKPFEYEIKLPFSINPAKMLQEDTRVEIKRDDQGNMLFTKVESDGTTTEVTDSRLPYKFSEEKNVVRSIDDAGQIVSTEVIEQVPTMWVDLKPVYIPVPSNKVIYFKDQPDKFTYDDIVQAKKKSIQTNSLNKMAYYSEMLSSDQFATHLKSHTSDMGLGFVSVKPEGSIRTEKITLGQMVDLIEVQVESQDNLLVEVGSTTTNFVPTVNGRAKLAAVTGEIYVRITNQTNKTQQVTSLAILV